MARAALERTESRGAHTRLDHPDADPALEGVNVVVRREGEGMALGRESVPELPEELRRIVESEPASSQA